MMRRVLQQVSVSTGERIANYALVAWLGVVTGWVGHDWATPVFCWYGV